MKRSRKIVSAVAILVFLTGTLLFVKREPDTIEVDESIVENPIVEIPLETPIEKPDDEPEEQSEKDRGPKNIVSLDRNQVSSIEFISGDNKILMENKDSRWLVNQGEVSRINNGKISSIIRDVLNLKSLETVSFSSENAGQWGLSDKSDNIIIKYEGKIISLLIGSLNPSKTGYYVQIKGWDEIFLIKNAYGDSLILSLDELRYRSLPVIDISRINTITINNESKINIVPYERSDMFTSEIFAYMMNEPYRNNIPVHNENLKSFLLKMEVPLEIVDFIDKGNPEEYGINDNEIGISIKEDSGKSLDLYLGKDADNNKVYCMMKGDDQIFTLYKKDLPFLQMKPFDFVDRFPHLIQLDSIDTLQIITDDLAIMGTIDRRNSSNDYAINGLEIEEKAFKSFYQDVLYLLMEGEAEQSVNTDDPEITISYKLYDGGSLWTHLNFYPYDSEYYAVARNENEPEFIIGRYQLKDMLNKVVKTVDELMGF